MPRHRRRGVRREESTVQVHKPVDLPKKARSIQEIRDFQRNINTLIPKMPFQRIVRSLAHRYSEKLRFSRSGMMALHLSAEQYVQELLEDAYVATLHAKRVTLYKSDIDLIFRLRHDKLSLKIRDDRTKYQT
ncbi:hypothetical protein PCE1_001217 [Barthelona sp. PCE]